MLFHFNRTLWPIIFATLQLKGMLPLGYSFDNKEHLTAFRLLLAQQEDKVLDSLKKIYPTTKTSNVVELCSKITFKIPDLIPATFER